MSGIVGILNLDGQPVDPQLLRRMTDAMAHRGPDGTGHWTNGSIGLGHRLLHTTPESLHETQPFVSHDGNLVMVCDGRIDNREELKAALGSTLRTDTDVELIAHAYERWGLDCPAHLIGDFAFAIWDQRNRRLFCARDPIGVKPFYYYWDGQRFLFSSEIKALLEVPGVPQQVNHAMIADLFCAEFRDPDATFFDGLNQLRAAHSLCLENRQLRLRRYWDPDPSATLSYPRQEDYFEQFLDLVRQAVQCRLRSHVPVGVMLSGGADSMLITATAETARRAHSALSPPLTAFTVLYEEFLQKEWEAIQHLVRTCGTDVHPIRLQTSHAAFPATELVLSRSETPWYSGILAHPLVFEPAKTHGCRVVLTGFGIDEYEGLSGIGILKDLLRHGRWISLVRETRSMAKTYQSPAWVILFQLRDHLPPWTRWVARTAGGRQVPRWIEPGFAKRLGLAWRLPLRITSRFPTLCQEESYRAITKPEFVLMLNQMDNAASRFTMDWRHPFLDRRLIEFFLAVPAHVKMTAGYRKPFVRSALQAILGGDVRDRPGEAYLIPPLPDNHTTGLVKARYLEQALGPSHGPLFRYVRYQQIVRVLRDLAQGRHRNTSPLWKLVVLNRWLQEFFPTDDNRDHARIDELEDVALVGSVASPSKGGLT